MSGMTVRRASRDCRGAMKMTPVLQSETGVIFSFCILFKMGPESKFWKNPGLRFGAYSVM